MSVLKIFLVEDEGLIAEHLKLSLEKLGYEVLGVAAKYSEAVAFLESNSPDLIIADIMLAGEKDGIDLGQHVRENYNLPYIFLTSHSDKSTVNRAKAVKPNGYLVKPYERSDLYVAIETAISNFQGGEGESEPDSTTPFESNTLFVKDREVYIKLDVNDILWMKAEGNYTHVESVNGKHLTRGNLKELLEKFKNHPFFRTHRSYAINLKQISSIQPQTVTIGEAEIPIAKESREELLSKINTL
jgi:DNA-binding LytR/AlgR family response regulator